MALNMALNTALDMALDMALEKAFNNEINNVLRREEPRMAGRSTVSRGRPPFDFGGGGVIVRKPMGSGSGILEKVIDEQKRRRAVRKRAGVILALALALNCDVADGCGGLESMACV
jgi:hypothetical protein